MHKKGAKNVQFLDILNFARLLRHPAAASSALPRRPAACCRVADGALTLSYGLKKLRTICAAPLTRALMDEPCMAWMPPWKSLA